MKFPTCFPHGLSTAAAMAAIAFGLLIAGSAGAQPVCASDGQLRPTGLLDRFINADCENCWADPATPGAAAGQTVLDWVIPGNKGDDAALSAVAMRDGLQRLEALRQAVPEAATSRNTRALGLKGMRLRVARGVALNGYLGASIELQPVPATAHPMRWTGWLALVETLPAGTEGSPVYRNLVRNLLQLDWDVSRQAAQGVPQRLFEARAMSIARGANPERLKLVGWVENESGQLLGAAQSFCAPEKK